MNFTDLEAAATDWKATYKGSVVWVFQPYSIGNWRFKNPTTRIWVYRPDRTGD